jgi:hypothetical protein
MAHDVPIRPQLFFSQHSALPCVRKNRRAANARLESRDLYEIPVT